MTVSTEQLRTLIQQELPDLIAIRRDLHAHPELAYDEKRTSGVVQRELAQAGIEFKAGLARGTGVLAHLPGNGQKAMGLRADMDALPIQEANGFEYRSQSEGRMHACGHDGHTTILIGTARVLAKLACAGGGLPRPVSFVFQPAEEGGAGAKRMVEDGVLDGTVLGPPVEHMFGLHGWPRVPLGLVGTRVGPMMAASDEFDLTVKGVGCHAAWPHVGRDPIVAAAAIVSAFQTIPSRSAPPLEALVLSVTKIRGGTAYNIIPGEVHLSGTVRTLKEEIQVLAEQRMQSVASAVAEAHGCQAAVHYSRGYPSTVNHPDAVKVFNTVARRALGAERVIDVPQPVMGGEDFAFYGQRVPACFFVLGLVPDGGTMAELHQPTFNFNDDAIATGVERFCQLAVRREP